jgi:hypothetical protein
MRLNKLKWQRIANKGEQMIAQGRLLVIREGKPRHSKPLKPLEDRGRDLLSWD